MGPTANQNAGSFCYSMVKRANTPPDTKDHTSLRFHSRSTSKAGSYILAKEKAQGAGIGLFLFQLAIDILIDNPTFCFFRQY